MTQFFSVGADEYIFCIVIKVIPCHAVMDISCGYFHFQHKAVPVAHCMGVLSFRKDRGFGRLLNKRFLD